MFDTTRDKPMFINIKACLTTLFHIFRFEVSRNLKFSFANVLLHSESFLIFVSPSRNLTNLNRLVPNAVSPYPHVIIVGILLFRLPRVVIQFTVIALVE